MSHTNALVFLIIQWMKKRGLWWSQQPVNQEVRWLAHNGLHPTYKMPIELQPSTTGDMMEILCWNSNSLTWWPRQSQTQLPALGCTALDSVTLVAASGPTPKWHKNMWKVQSASIRVHSDGWALQYFLCALQIRKSKVNWQQKNIREYRSESCLNSTGSRTNQKSLPNRDMFGYKATTQQESSMCHVCKKK